MNKYITRINALYSMPELQYRHNMTAKIAYQLGFKEMGIYAYNSRNESWESKSARYDGIIAGISNGDIVVFQTPTGNGLDFERGLIDRIKAYGGRVVFYIHDFEPLKNDNECGLLAETVLLYNQAEVLIVPSYHLKRFLQDNGIRQGMKFVIQEMWDYMGETLFLNMQNVGMETDSMIGSFGRLWYRDEKEQEYMEYCSPFILGKFLASGIPVIVPPKMVSRKLIEKNRLGLSVNSLDEAITFIKLMDESECKEYVLHARDFAPMLRDGINTKKAFVDAVQLLYRKDTLGIPKIVCNMGECMFSYVSLNESYDGKMALSWSYKGKADGFLICSEDGMLVGETENVYQHLYYLEDNGRKNGFIVKAYINSLEGWIVIAESEPAFRKIRKQSKPKVSLIVPAYNAETCIVRSIDTAIAQSFCDIEIIVINDGSTDETMKIIDWYTKAYSNVKAICQENKGVAAARNAGLAQAEGDYISFLDSDDMMRPDMIRKLYDSIKKNNCDIAVTSAFHLTDEGYLLSTGRVYPILKEDVPLSMEEFFKAYFINGYQFTAIWNKLYRASLAKSVLFQPIMYEDHAWTDCILSYADNICWLDDPLYEYDRTQSDGTLSTEWFKASKEKIFAGRKEAIMSYLKNGNHEKLSLLKKLAERELNYFFRVNAFEKNDYEKLRKEIENFQV